MECWRFWKTFQSSYFKCIKTSLIPWFKCNNQNQNSSNYENNPNDENADDIFDENDEIPKSPFFILILKTWCKLEKMLLLKQMVQFTSFSSYITKELGKYHWSSWRWFGHKYHPGSNICGKYLEIFKDN